ncbi:Avidin/streptavidin [Mycena vitilis]|nr:Avidin/streptavidin [Mycena vitilis]
MGPHCIKGTELSRNCKMPSTRFLTLCILFALTNSVSWALQLDGRVNLNFTGEWFNELGSKMVLLADGTGNITGQYNSAVGKAEDFYVLTGRFDIDPPGQDEGVSIGWVVNYRNVELNAHSTAAWSGQFFNKDASGDQRILTQWLLTTSSTPADLWSSTQIGHDEFGRAEPSTAEIARARAFRRGFPYPQQILSLRR